MTSKLFIWLACASASSLCHAQPATLYENNFEQATVGAVPEDFLVLDGAFTVKQDNLTNKVLELPGAPLDSFAVQFGPAATTNIAVSASIKSSARGRRYPIFGVGINGVSGFRLQVSPNKKALELYQDQTLKVSNPFEWKPEQWLNLKLQVRAARDGYKVEAKAWERTAKEPADWSLTLDTKEAPSAGRSSVFASPFSGTPIEFDDLRVEKTSGPA
jgi:hypothetical protein